MRMLMITPLLACLFLLGCSRGEPQLEVKEDKLVDILIDVHIAEAAVQNLRGETHDRIINLYYEQIFGIHGVEREEFESTMAYLREKPDRMEAIYAEVMAEMERREAQKEGQPN